MIEIVSPANKERAEHVDDFTSKAAAALRRVAHLLVVDLFPPGPHDAEGMHGKLQQRIESTPEPYVVPSDEPITLSAYVAGPVADVLWNTWRWAPNCPRCRCSFDSTATSTFR